MESGFSLRTALQDVLGSLSDALAGFLPRALTALVVIVLGFLLAKLTARIIRTTFSPPAHRRGIGQGRRDQPPR